MLSPALVLQAEGIKTRQLTHLDAFPLAADRTNLSRICADVQAPALIGHRIREQKHGEASLWEKALETRFNEREEGEI